MSQAAVQFDQQHYQDAREAYQDLNEVISDIALDVKRDNDVTYSVVWETENHDYGADYRVIDTDRLALEDTLIIQGQSRGGTYEVVPKASGPPVVRYHHPEGSIGWEEEASELIIMYGRFEYDPDERGNLVDWVREKIPR